MRRTVMRATLVAALVFVLASAFGFSPDKDLASARRFFRSGDMDQAMRLARRSVFFGEDGRDAQLLVARVATALHNTDYAVDVLGQILDSDVNHVPALLARARLLMESGDLRGALNDFDAGLYGAQKEKGGWPRNMAGHLARRGVVLFDMGRVQEARRDGKVAMALDENAPWPHLLASRLLEEEGRLMAALQAHEKALMLLRARDGYFFLVPENRGLTRRLVVLRGKAGVPANRPILPGLSRP